MIVPQSLLAHEGLRDAAFYTYRRIVRIAVREKLRRKGLGSMLLRSLSGSGKRLRFHRRLIRHY